MGRGKKNLFDSEGMDRRDTGHYPTPPEVAAFLAKEMLSIRPDGRKAIDPCVGTGTLLSPFRAAGIDTHGIDVYDWRKYPMDSFAQADSLQILRDELDGGMFAESFFESFDYIVLNPPYNCHESNYIRDNKGWLLKTFPDVGIANMYAMFLAGVIRAASAGTVIGVITLDSFLNSRLHEPLRRLILAQCTVHVLALCPSDLFHSQNADVRTCILILQKGIRHRNKVRVLDRVTNKEDFYELLHNSGNWASFDPEKITLSDPRDRHEIVVGVPDDVRVIFDGPRLSELFPCITGVSTGNDKKYLVPSRDYAHNVPFYKNPASRRFWMEPDAYLIDDFDETSKKISNFMVRNRSLLLQSGISCSSMGVNFSAVFRPAGTIFGVNPNIVCDDTNVWWLLGYLNSRLATYMVRGVLLRTNMVTSGYVSRLPIPEFSAEAKQLLGERARIGYSNRVDQQEADQLRQEIDKIIREDVSLTDHTSDLLVGLDL